MQTDKRFKNVSDNLDEITDKGAIDIVKLYLSEISKYEQLSKEEANVLWEEKSSGSEEAKMKLIKHNLGLVIYIAKKYMNKGISFTDLIQEGNLGLIKAVNRYDLSINAAFSTVAYDYIETQIRRFVAVQNKNFKVGIAAAESMNIIKAEMQRFYSIYGYTPTPEELSKTTRFSAKKITKLLNSNTIAYSLNYKFDVDDKKLEERVEYCGFEDEILNKVQSEELHEAVLNSSSFTKREKQVFEKMFIEGLNIPQSSQALGISHQAVQQTKNRFIEKLKKNKYLMSFLIEDASKERVLVR